MTKARIEELAKKALESGNPYKMRATQFFVDREVRYLYGNKVMTEKEINDAYLETARKDVKNGFNERMVGYYDKWYRYTRADEGRAYDLGVHDAVANSKCPEEMHIIPCAH